MASRRQHTAEVEPFRVGAVPVTSGMYAHMSVDVVVVLQILMGALPKAHMTVTLIEAATPRRAAPPTHSPHARLRLMMWRRS